MQLSRLSLTLLLAVTLCAAVGCRKDDPVLELPGRLWDQMTGRTPITGVRKMEDLDFPDERREGINILAARSFGREEPYISRYRQIAQFDKDPLVRATALRALNRARDEESVALFVRSLKDPSPLVRLEAAKALANVPDPAAQEALITALQQRTVEDPTGRPQIRDASRDIRIAAAQALRHYKNLATARALVSTLQDRDFGVSWQARRSLAEITGRDLGYDEAKWLEFLAGPDQPFG